MVCIVHGRLPPSRSLVLGLQALEGEEWLFGSLAGGGTVME